ncbi:MAG: DUF6370 family protein [Chitinophagales bacterium]
MKHILAIALLLVFAATSMAQINEHAASPPDSVKKNQTVEAACGQCQFGMPGKGCNLAVRIDGQAYFVDGTDIDGHGDAHASDGFCEAIRKAEVQGEIANNRFNASYFMLLPESKEKEPKE